MRISYFTEFISTISGNQFMKMGRKRRRLSSSSAPIYESPLMCFRESLNDSLGDLIQKEKRLTRSASRKLRKQNTNIPSIDSSRNSVIVINSDNETNDANDKEDMSLSIIECSTSTDISSSQQEKLQNKKLLSCKRKRKRSSVVLLDNDSSFIQLSDTRKSSNGENIAPSQTEDDIVELWSCLGSKVDKNNRSTRKCNRNAVNKKLNFVIDKTPDMKNLKCLRTVKASSSRKKRKICNNSDTNTLPLNESMTQMTERSKESRRKRYEKHCNNNANSNFACPDAYCNKKRSKKSDKVESDKSDIESDKVEKFRSTSNSKHKLREIIVDGCNVAKMYTHGHVFSEKGIELVIDYFKSRGHVVKVFLPNHVRRKEYLFLEDLYREGTIVFTPSRYIDGKKITPYDDRYILEYATRCEGIVISSDQYRDLYEEKPEWRDTILNRLLMPTFVGDYIMFPEDPLGKYGPNLKTFLRH